MTNGNQLSREEQAWLVEYQACQHDNNSLPSEYWTMAGIFIGISTALLGGLIHAVLSNKNLLQIVLSNGTYGLQRKECLMLGIIACVISVAVIVILYFLKRWLKRFSFIQQVNFARMREIERELGMWKSWRVHGIDNWVRETFREVVSDSDKKRLFDYKLSEWWHKMRKRCDPKFPEYEGSSRVQFDRIFHTLFGLWTLVLIAGLYLLVGSLVAIIALIFFALWVVYLIVRKTIRKMCTKSGDC